MHVRACASVCACAQVCVCAHVYEHERERERDILVGTLLPPKPVGTVWKDGVS
jgi:hypothetical protein